MCCRFIVLGERAEVEDAGTSPCQSGQSYSWVQSTVFTLQAKPPIKDHFSGGSSQHQTPVTVVSVDSRGTISLPFWMTGSQNMCPSSTLQYSLLTSSSSHTSACECSCAVAVGCIQLCLILVASPLSQRKHLRSPSEE